MKHLIILLSLLVGTAAIAQNPPAWDRLDQTIALRFQLQQMAKTGQRNDAQPVFNELLALQSDTSTVLLWDERWLLYFWLGRYGDLLREIEAQTDSSRLHETITYMPPSDSLFHFTDKRVYSDYDQIINHLKTTTLDDESLEFAQLELDHLLRDNRDETKAQRGAFLKKYPQSRFASFITTYMKLPVPPKKAGFGLDLLMFNSNWTNELERTIVPGWGIQADLQITWKRWIFGGRFQSGKQQLTRNVVDFDDTWKKGSKSLMRHYQLEIGYGVFDTPKIKCFPSLVFGGASLLDNLLDSGDEKAFIYTYDGFEYGGNLTFDIKPFKKQQENFKSGDKSYSGIRVRAGYTHLPFGDTLPELSGNMLFFAVGFNVYFK